MLRVLRRAFHGLIQSLKVIFHQTVGLLFALLGTSAGLAAWKEYRAVTPEVPSTQVRFYVTTGFAVLLLGFAASSFFRAWAARRTQAPK